MSARLLAPAVDEVESTRRGRIRRALITWGQENWRSYPWRVSGASPYEVLIAEVLLKRTTATAAARVYLGFLGRFPNFATLASAKRSEIEEVLAPVGLSKQRANGLLQLARFVLEHHGGRLPSKLAELLRVPHVGDYSARAVQSFGFGRPAAVVDSNVTRILRRVFSRTLGPRPRIKDVQAIADWLSGVGHRHRELNWALLDLGAMVCRYDRPRCAQCPIARICSYSLMGGEGSDRCGIASPLRQLAMRTTTNTGRTS